MVYLGRWARRFRLLAKRNRTERAMDAELRHHIERRPGLAAVQTLGHDRTDPRGSMMD